MKVGTPGFLSERLKEARAARRIATMKELAELIDMAPSAVSRWEKGEHAPDADALTKLSNALKVRREYFLRPISPRSSAIFYRSRADAVRRDRHYQEAQMAWLGDISEVVEHYVALPEVNLPDFVGSTHFMDLHDEDIEGFANKLREHWGLGYGPCPDLVPLMERMGCIIASINMGTTKLDGLTSWQGRVPRPHVLLGADRGFFPRRQMNAAHELGHIILHRHVTDKELADNLQKIEEQAFRFASAFLLPSEGYPHELLNYSLASMQALKARWRVSIKAQIFRLKSLDLIDADFATRLYKLYSAKGWSSEEPLDREWPLSKPQLLAEALRLIVSSGVRRKEDLLAVEFIASASDVENLTALPNGWFGTEAQVVRLSLRDRPAGGMVSEDAEVLPFRRREE